MPSAPPRTAPVAQRRGEQAAGRAAAQAQGGDQRLEREQGEQQAEAADAEERVAGHVQAVAEQLRVPDADDAEDAEGDHRREQRRGAPGAVMGDPADEPDVTGRDQPDDRAGQQRPGHHRPGEPVVGDAGVDGPVRQVHPCGGGRDRRAGDGRQHDGQGDAADEDLGGEQGAGQRDVVDGGEPGAAAARHQQPPLLRRQAAPAGQDAAGCAAQQLGRGLPADRGAHPDDDLGDHRGAQAAAERQPPVAVPHRLVDLGRLALGVAPQQEPRHAAECARDQQRGDPPRRGCLLHAVLQAAFVVAERGVLHVEQDRHHQRAEQAGGDAGQHHHHPEPGGEDARAVAGDVRLLHRPAAGRHALLEQRLRAPHALAGPGRPPVPHGAEPARRAGAAFPAAGTGHAGSSGAVTSVSAIYRQ